MYKSPLLHLKCISTGSKKENEIEMTQSRVKSMGELQYGKKKEEKKEKITLL